MKISDQISINNIYQVKDLLVGIHVDINTCKYVFNAFLLPVAFVRALIPLFCCLGRTPKITPNLYHLFCFKKKCHSSKTTKLSLEAKG